MCLFSYFYRKLHSTGWESNPLPLLFLLLLCTCRVKTQQFIMEFQAREHTPGLQNHTAVKDLFLNYSNLIDLKLRHFWLVISFSVF